MAGLPRGTRWLLIAANLVLAVGLGFQLFGEGITSDFSFVVTSFVLLNLAFNWEGIVQMVRATN